MSEMLNKSLEELRIEKGQMDINRQRVANEKKSVAAQLTELNAEIGGKKHPHDVFHRLQKRRSELVRMLNEKESELAEVNSQISGLNTFIDVRTQQSKESKLNVRKLIEMRDRWHEHSMNPTRDQKTREVFWKCSQEIREFLKPYFASSGDSRIG